MCGIAGAVDLNGRRNFPEERLLKMTGALAHRGPNDEHIHIEPGLALGVRRLSVIDVANGRQPLSNETGDVWVAFEGELYDYPEIRTRLLANGHRLNTRCDTEAWVHLYEDQGEETFRQALGQFGVSLWDRKQRTLFLARDRSGISPLFYAQADGWLLWASEIKGLLASGLIEAKPDVRGLDYFFHFFSLPDDGTCFQGIRLLPAGHLAKVRDGNITLKRYWDLDFPDQGQERRYDDPEKAAEELEELLRGAVRRRLVGEVPLSCYLSGGLDSTVILGLASQERGQPIHSFTVGLDNAGPSDERTKAAESARLIGSPLTTVNVTEMDLINHYPKLIQAAEGPVLDTACIGSLLMAAANGAAGNIVALTGEGADELLAGYVWFKWHRVQRAFHKYLPRVTAGLRNFALGTLIGGGKAHRPSMAWTDGVRPAQQLSWEFMAQSRERLFSADLWKRLDGYQAPADLYVPTDRFRPRETASPARPPPKAAIRSSMSVWWTSARAWPPNTSCAAGPTNGCCAASPPACSPRRSLAAPRPSSAPTWAKPSCVTTAPPGWTNSSAPNRCAPPATSTSTASTTPAPPSCRCAKRRCAGCRWTWA